MFKDICLKEIFYSTLHEEVRAEWRQARPGTHAFIRICVWNGVNGAHFLGEMGVRREGAGQAVAHPPAAVPPTAPQYPPLLLLFFLAVVEAPTSLPSFPIILGCIRKTEPTLCISSRKRLNTGHFQCLENGWETRLMLQPLGKQGVQPSRSTTTDIPGYPQYQRGWFISQCPEYAGRKPQVSLLPKSMHLPPAVATIILSSSLLPSNVSTSHWGT